MQVWLMLLAICAAAVGWLRRRRYYLKLTGNVATLSGELPVLGHCLKLVGSTEVLYRTILDIARTTIDNGGIVKFWLGPSFCMTVSEPTVCQFVLNKLPKIFMYSFTSDWTGQGLITCLDESIHRLRRRILSPCFNQQVVNSYLSVINQQARGLVARMAPFQGKGRFDHQKLITDFTFYNVCQTIMGLDATVRNAGEYQAQVDRALVLLISRCTRVWQHWDWLYRLSGGYREYSRCCAALHRMCNEFIEQRRAKLLANKNDSKDHQAAFVDVLLEEEAAGHLAPREVRDEVQSLIVGGYDTTAGVLTLVIVALGSHPAEHQRVVEEIQKVFGDSHRDVNKDDLTELVYLEAVIKECLRVYPPATTIAKEADKTYEIGDVVIPEGTSVFVSLWAMNRVGWGADAHVFRPGRWLEPQHGCFASFSQGKRVCLGRSFAMATMKTAMVHLLRHFRFTGNIDDVVIDYGFICKPVRGHFVSCEGVLIAL